MIRKNTKDKKICRRAPPDGWIQNLLYDYLDLLKIKMQGYKSRCPSEQESNRKQNGCLKINASVIHPCDNKDNRHDDKNRNYVLNYIPPHKSG